jgi:hypothetical protein
MNNDNINQCPNCGFKSTVCAQVWPITDQVSKHVTICGGCGLPVGLYPKFAAGQELSNCLKKKYEMSESGIDSIKIIVAAVDRFVAKWE